MGNDNCVEFRNQRRQIPPATWRYSFAKCRVKLYEHLDGTLSIGYGPHTLGHYDAPGTPYGPKPFLGTFLLAEGAGYYQQPDRSLAAKTGHLDLLLTALFWHFFDFGKST